MSDNFSKELESFSKKVDDLVQKYIEKFKESDPDTFPALLAAATTLFAKATGLGIPLERKFLLYLLSKEILYIHMYYKSLDNSYDVISELLQALLKERDTATALFATLAQKQTPEPAPAPEEEEAVKMTETEPDKTDKKTLKYSDSTKYIV